MIEEKKIDIESFGKSKLSIDYPYLEIVELNETLPLVVNALEDGEMKLIVCHKGVKKFVKSISASAYNINRLLRTGQKLLYYKSEQEHFELNTILEYLEVV